MIDNWLEIITVTFFTCLTVNAWAKYRYTALMGLPVWFLYYANRLPYGVPFGDYLQIIGFVIIGYIVYAGATRERTLEFLVKEINKH